MYFKIRVIEFDSWWDVGCEIKKIVNNDFIILVFSNMNFFVIFIKVILLYCGVKCLNEINLKENGRKWIGDR